jgi:zinc transport system permease protein
MTDHDSGPTWAEFAIGWQLDIYRDPVCCGVFAGLVLGYLGVFVVLRRSVFLTAAVSQAAGLGVALAFYVQIHFALELPPIAGAMLCALAFSALLALPIDRLPISREAVLALAYLGEWAGAVMVGDRIQQEAHQITSILFGTAVLVAPVDLWTLVGVGGASLAAVAALHRGLAFAIFDREGARVHGLPVRRLEIAVWLLIALTVSAATRALGVLPVFAFSVMPGVAALMLCSRVRTALLAALAMGGVSGGAGYLLAFFAELPVGACQTAVAVLFFAGALTLHMLTRGRAARH